MNTTFNLLGEGVMQDARLVLSVVAGVFTIGAVACWFWDYRQEALAKDRSGHSRFTNVEPLPDPPPRLPVSRDGNIHGLEWNAIEVDRASGVGRIAAERWRQIERSGYDAQHDDAHTDASMTEAAIAYAIHSLNRPNCAFDWWPKKWSEDEWKPAMQFGRSEPIRNLEKAGALIAAEIDRLQRAQFRASAEKNSAALSSLDK